MSLFMFIDCEIWIGEKERGLVASGGGQGRLLFLGYWVFVDS